MIYKAETNLYLKHASDSNGTKIMKHKFCFGKVIFIQSFVRLFVCC